MRNQHALNSLPSRRTVVVDVSKANLGSCCRAWRPCRGTTAGGAKLIRSNTAGYGRSQGPNPHQHLKKATPIVYRRVTCYNDEREAPSPSALRDEASPSSESEVSRSVPRCHGLYGLAMEHIRSEPNGSPLVPIASRPTQVYRCSHTHQIDTSRRRKNIKAR